MFETIENETYKVVVTDTGLTSSLVASAVARAGHKVLHIDRERTYGGDWKALHLLPFVSWTFSSGYIRSKENDVKSFNKNKDETLVGVDWQYSLWKDNIEADFSIFQHSSRFRQAFSQWIKKMKITEEDVDKLLNDFQAMLNELQSVKEKSLDIETILIKWKQTNFFLRQLDNAFTIDLCPRVLLAKGTMIKLLIQSNVSRYLSFRNISRILAPIRYNYEIASPYHIEPMPLTRADVFQSKILSLIEKRLLMRFLQNCYESIKSRGNNFLADWDVDRPIEEFLRIKQKLPEKLIEMVINTLLMTQKTMTTTEAIEKIVAVLESLGKFCDKPYLWCAYGADDLAQAFCRYGAIYGGDYCLGVETRGLLVAKTDDNHSVVHRVITDEFIVSAEHVVTSLPIPELIEHEKEENKKLSSISKAIICSTRSILPAEDSEHSCLLYLPPSYTESVEVFLLEVDSFAGTVPEGLYLQYIWCDAFGDSAKVDLKSTVEKLLLQSSQLHDCIGEEMLVWSVYFRQECIQPNYGHKLPLNVHLVNQPSNEVDFELACQQAMDIFKQILPEAEFFPETQELDYQTIDDDSD